MIGIVYLQDLENDISNRGGNEEDADVEVEPETEDDAVTAG